MNGPGAFITTSESIGWTAASNQVTTADDDLARVHDALGALAGAGIRAVRIGLDWARLQPRESVWDGQWVERYRNVLEAARHHDLEVWAGLFEGVVPTWFDDLGNFADRRAGSRSWSRYVDGLVVRLAEHVDGWMPIDRPAQFIRAAYSAGTWPPRRRDETERLAVTEHLALAWRDAAIALKGVAPLAFVFDLERPEIDGVTDSEREAQQHERHLIWDLWIRLLRDGTLSIPGRGDRQIDGMAGSASVVCLVVPPPDPWWVEATERLVVRAAGELGLDHVSLVDRHGPLSDAENHLVQVRSLTGELGRDGIEVDRWWAATGVARPGTGRVGLINGSTDEFAHLWSQAMSSSTR